MVRDSKWPIGLLAINHEPKDRRLKAENFFLSNIYK